MEKKMTNTELKKVFDAGKELEALIMNADADQVAELDNYVGDDFPIGIDVEFDDAGKIEEINVQIGHVDGYEWHELDGDIEIIRAERHKLLKRLTDHIEIAISNHRDQIRINSEFAA
jgi:hypothetical protein